MMMRAYAEEYLSDAMKNLGEAVDYAVNCCGLDLDEFSALFVSSGFAESFGKGNPKVIAGLSGTELVMEILAKSNKSVKESEPQTEYEYSSFYWAGWILAYYQWYTGIPFKDIFNIVTLAEIEKLYNPLHEASEDKFVDVVNEFARRKTSITKLQRQRKLCGYSQKELSEKSGVNLRTLQQYELRAKDINKASVTTLLALSRVLGCNVEDLIEYDFSSKDD